MSDAPTRTDPITPAATGGAATDGTVTAGDGGAAFALLRAGVPLSLLLDLALPVHSAELLADERADLSWVPRRVA